MITTVIFSVSMFIYSFVHFFIFFFYRSNEKRKERSRDAARCRRSRETDIFTELAAALPVSQEQATHLDKASVMRLAIAYLKVRAVVDSSEFLPCKFSLISKLFITLLHISVLWLVKKKKKNNKKWRRRRRKDGRISIDITFLIYINFFLFFFFPLFTFSTRHSCKDRNVRENGRIVSGSFEWIHAGIIERWKYGLSIGKC